MQGYGGTNFVSLKFCFAPAITLPLIFRIVSFGSDEDL